VFPSASSSELSPPSSQSCVIRDTGVVVEESRQVYMALAMPEPKQLLCEQLPESLSSDLASTSSSIVGASSGLRDSG